MSRFKGCAALATLLAAGCASTPEEIARNAGAQTAQGEAEAAATAPTEIVTLALTASDVDPSSVVTCRDILKTGSNVIVTRCMTHDDWERYERFQTIEAQQILRMLQGSAYR